MYMLMAVGLTIPQLVQITINPSSGETMASRCACVIRGGRKPELVDFTSSMADGLGTLLSELMLTWAKAAIPARRNAGKNSVMYFMEIVLIVHIRS